MKSFCKKGTLYSILSTLSITLIVASKLMKMNVGPRVRSLEKAHPALMPFVLNARHGFVQAKGKTKHKHKESNTGTGNVKRAATSACMTHTHAQIHLGKQVLYARVFFHPAKQQCTALCHGPARFGSRINVCICSWDVFSFHLVPSLTIPLTG